MGALDSFLQGLAILSEAVAQQHWCTWELVRMCRLPPTANLLTHTLPFSRIPRLIHMHTHTGEGLYGIFLKLERAGE